ncbi:segregation and condensation protein B [Peptoclostridium litorale DSM 5388]|uniref:Segregation and condensation protein B n=1 Tax=Peptoclostridium litorale DSM 5388 TaxID=1121324 RepID=A0A069RAW4_PEPLI|nr:SMC-Scp complex subunit ScpB [Peptoclostridium litorale]KDR94189.1 segregation and condensation protein B [Peptoclostridium litorale DSM 5388]SIN82045.1 segregation and condensation protein B [Peptoclostridium litorale DSM 5388]
MESKEIKGIIESLLFVYSEPMKIDEISSILDIDGKRVKEEIESLIEEYQNSDSGINIVKLENKYQMVTNPKYDAHIRKLLRPQKKKSLTQAAIETLSIIAYKQPVTKIEIEEIRGVKSDKPIRTLLDNSLIHEAGRLKRIGNPIIYKTTDEFLRIFGFESIKELPDIDSFEEDVE